MWNHTLFVDGSPHCSENMHESLVWWKTQKAKKKKIRWGDRLIWHGRWSQNRFFCFKSFRPMWADPLQKVNDFTWNGCNCYSNTKFFNDKLTWCENEISEKKDFGFSIVFFFVAWALTGRAIQFCFIL